MHPYYEEIDRDRFGQWGEKGKGSRGAREGREGTPKVSRRQLGTPLVF